MSGSDQTIDKLNYLRRKIAQNTGRKPTEKELAAGLELSVEETRQIMRPEISADYSDGLPADDLEAAMLALQKHPELMNGLSPRQRMVARLRIGLHDGQKQTIAEIAEIMGLAARVVRQVEQRTMARLNYRT